MLREFSPELTSRQNQIRLYLGSSAYWRAAEQEGIIPTNRKRVFFGPSAGEFAALTGARHWSFKEGLAQISVRGEEMGKANEINPGKMLIVTGLPFEEGEKIAEDYDRIVAANDNPGTQTVFSGDEVGLMEIAAYLASTETWKHVRVDWAAIAEAAHHPIHMAPAVAGVKAALKRAKFTAPKERQTFIGNQAKPLHNVRDARAHLVAQLTRGVLLRQSVQAMKNEYDVATFYDVGPGKILYTQLRHQFRREVELVSVADELLPERS